MIIAVNFPIYAIGKKKPEKISPDFFQASSFELHKLENSLR